jgi:hypothetical protein
MKLTKLPEIIGAIIGAIAFLILVGKMKTIFDNPISEAEILTEGPYIKEIMLPGVIFTTMISRWILKKIKFRTPIITLIATIGWGIAPLLAIFIAAICGISTGGKMPEIELYQLYWTLIFIIGTGIPTCLSLIIEKSD